MKVFGLGRPPRYPPERPQDIPPQSFMFRLLFRSLFDKQGKERKDRVILNIFDGGGVIFFELGYVR